ncbi:hypothetical protein G9464_07540 [Halostella sp. JP-L12]|uniref:DUF7283 family protein n=1 Tax=Halostella TaxID=1843185 RepID=UPI000EF76AA0|nr:MULTISPECIES: hypothetical protein [Halostella]NHN47447.1 hypothetical protein [Halostella sp. JP-L12]
MFDAPVDTWYLAVGVALAGVAFAGVAADLPTRAPPDAAGAAATIDAVAASERPGTAEHPVDAPEIKLGPHRVALRNGGGTASETFAYGPVTPVTDGGPLATVLRGRDPVRVFPSPDALRRAAAAARERDPEWRRADGRIVVRTITWEGTRVTLVDA